MARIARLHLFALIGCANSTCSRRADVHLQRFRQLFRVLLTGCSRTIHACFCRVGPGTFIPSLSDPDLKCSPYGLPTWETAATHRPIPDAATSRPCARTDC